MKSVMTKEGRGTAIDLAEEERKRIGPTRDKSESISDAADASDSQCEKHDDLTRKQELRRM
jgi:hypothetical protein